MSDENLVGRMVYLPFQIELRDKKNPDLYLARLIGFEESPGHALFVPKEIILDSLDADTTIEPPPLTDEQKKRAGGPGCAEDWP